MQPERPLSTESVYDGKIIRVRVDEVSLPDGTQTSREVVEHSASVVAVPVDSEGNVLLVRQYRYPVRRFLLEAPAGKVEESETPDSCVRRELQEETGYASRDLKPLGSFWMSPGFSTELMHAYLAKDLVPSKLDADKDENILVERFPLSGVQRLIRQGEIQDAKTIAALLLITCLLDSA